MTVRVTTGETKFHVLFTGDSKAISSFGAVLSKSKNKFMFNPDHAKNGRTLNPGN